MLSDEIERFIKTMLCEGERHVELKRNELAHQFGCAPSQINYVLSTRFTVDHGYLIESRRGGGGYIRVVRVTVSDDDERLARLLRRIGERISREEADAILQGLFSAEILDARTAHLMRAALEISAVAPGARDYLRAGILKNMLEALMLWDAKEVKET